jgi:hypothetical protein
MRGQHLHPLADLHFILRIAPNTQPQRASGMQRASMARVIPLDESSESSVILFELEPSVALSAPECLRDCGSCTCLCGACTPELLQLFIVGLALMNQLSSLSLA